MCFVFLWKIYQSDTSYIKHFLKEFLKVYLGKTFKKCSRPLDPKVLVGHIGRGKDDTKSAFERLGQGENRSESVI